MARWTSKDISKTGLATKSTPVGKSKIPSKTPDGIVSITKHLRNQGIEHVTEHKFLAYRKFRFDVAILPLKIAIEYEGLMSEKSGHTTLVGFTKNTEKYNLAVIDGWKLLRYTCKNYQDFGKDLERLLNSLK